MTRPKSRTLLAAAYGICFEFSALSHETHILMCTIRTCGHGRLEGGLWLALPVRAVVSVATESKPMDHAHMSVCPFPISLVPTYDRQCHFFIPNFIAPLTKDLNPARPINQSLMFSYREPCFANVRMPLVLFR